MIIVISDTELFTGEANAVNQLFDSGLLLFHLRKYNNSNSEIVNFINQIESKYRSRIVLHQFHEMANEFGLKRLHFSERDRLSKSEVEFKQLQQSGMILSTSVHSVEEYENLSSVFDYAFLSPVFDSISKPDYKAQKFEINKKSTIKLIALGGINESNCQLVYEMGFDGVALLGSIWKSENNVEEFIIIKNKLAQIYAENI